MRPGIVNELFDLIPASFKMLIRRLPAAAQIGFDLMPARPEIPSRRVRTKVVGGLMDGAQGLCHVVNMAKSRRGVLHGCATIGLHLAVLGAAASAGAQNVAGVWTNQYMIGPKDSVIATVVITVSDDAKTWS